MIRLLPPFQVQLRRPSRSCRDRALRAGAVHARRPRPGGVPNATAALGCQSRGRSAAKSMDGAEHSAMLKDVMAGVYAPGQNLVQIRRVTRFRPMSRTRSAPAAGCRRDRRPHRRSERRIPAARSRRCPLRHRQASRGVNDPIRSGRGATPRARRRGLHTTAC